MSFSAVATTEVVLLTAGGRGPVASIHVQGPQATSLISARFVSLRKSPVDKVPVASLLFGYWVSDACALRSGKKRCCAAKVRIAGKSIVTAATPRPRLFYDPWSLAAESCATLQFGSNGNRRTRSSLPLQRALLHASTERTAAILLDQARGALGRCVEQVISRLQCGDSQTATSLLDRLLQLAKVGRHLTQPWRVAIAGPPNAGKSSLMNRLLGYERTIVFGQPGTTRDSVTALTALDGWPIEPIDTAGLRVPRDAIEAEGVNRTRSEAQTADLVLLIHDRSTPAVPVDLGLARTASVLNVANKSDLAAHPSYAGRLPSFLVSARTGEGIPPLSQAIAQRLVNPSPLPGEAVPFTTAQIESLHRAWSLIRQGQAAAAQEQLSTLSTNE